MVPVLKPIRVRGVFPKLEVYDNALGPLVGACSAMEAVLKINTYYSTHLGGVKIMAGCATGYCKLIKVH